MKLSNLKFTIFYSIYSFFLFNIPLFIHFTKILQPSTISDVSLIFSLLFITSCITANFFLIIFCKKITKFLAILFLIVNSSIFYFISHFKIPVDEAMVLNFFSTDAKEVGELISSRMLLFIGIFGVLPSIFIFFIKLNYNFAKDVKFFICTVLLSLALLFANYAKFAVFFRVNRGMEDLFVPFNYLMPLFVISKDKIYWTSSQEPDIEIDDLKIDKTQDVNIVLIIGETARKKNFEIYGYERKTNPELSKIKDLKILNGISCGTSTRISVPCIFEFKQGYESYLASISKAGAFVKWYENNYGGCYGACKNVETFKSNHDKCDGSCPDGVIFKEFYKDLENLKNDRKPKLFVLHQNGNHGPLYYKRYPRSFAKFQPECKTANVNTCNIESLVNAYDNGILYTDFLISEAIQKLKQTKKPSILIFVSDHGESLGENGIFLHGFPYSIAPKEQKEIPFIIWSSYNLNIKKQEEYIHKNVLQSVLKILKANTKYKDETLNILE